MQRYVVIRLVQAVFVLVAISMIVFALARASGDPTALMLPLDASPQERERLRHFWGLDQPYPIQYFKFVSNAVQGDFGDSFKWPGRTAMDLVGERFVASLQLSATALVLAALMAVALGVITATAKDTPLDFLGKIFALLGQSSPSFWIGIMLIWVFSVELGWLPTSGRGTVKHMVLPVITVGWFQVAAIMRLTRSSMLDTLDSEYVKLARLKGLQEWKVVWKHCLRNAAITTPHIFRADSRVSSHGVGNSRDGFRVARPGAAGGDLCGGAGLPRGAGGLDGVLRRASC